MCDEKRDRRKYILNKIFIEWAFSLVIGFSLFVVFRDDFNTKSGSFKFVISAILIGMIFKGIKRYKDYMKNSERSDKLYKAKMGSQIIMLEQYLLAYEKSVEIQKQKLSNLNTFSPIPIVIVSVEYFTKILKINLSKIFSNVTSLNFEFDMSERLALIIFVVVIFYTNKYITTWQRYKSAVHGSYEAKRHLLEVK
ncbi:hypothetical protein [Sporosarcina sp. D27]|uniref:hypothetical protein n=1 Tax=Sporosarcina sp. D27 TaxID=1382305 RepID=UPI000470DB3E|nr:hypothetical protein [Sporosarcina sp. D27]